MAEVKVVQANGSTVTVESTSVPVINVSSPSVGVVKVVGGVISFETATIPNAPGGGLDDQYLTSDGTTAYWDYVRNIFVNVRNNTGATINAGTPVYATGLVGQNITIAPADAISELTLPAIGILYQQLENNTNGVAIISGLFKYNISGFSGLQVGDTLFVANGGGLTTTKPTGSDYIQNIGVILKTNGNKIQEMKVSAIDRVNDVPNLSEGKFFIGSTANTVASSYTVPTSIGTSGQVLQSDGTNVVFADNEVSATDINTLHTSTYVIVQSSTGADDTINPANSTDAGVMTASDKNKLDSLRFYNTVADMIADDGLSNGDLVRTAGYLSYGDGGGLKYEVKNTGTPTSGTIIDLTGGLYAHAFLPTTVNPIMFGAKVDDDDTAVATANTTALNGMFAYMGSLVDTDNSSIACEFVAGTIYINDEVKMPMGTGNQTLRHATFVIDFNGAKVIGLDTGTPYTMFSRKKTDLDLAYNGIPQSSLGVEYLNHRYDISNGIVFGPNRTDPTTLMQIQCTYGSTVRNMKFNNAHIALTMQFCLMALLEQNMYNSVNYGSVLSTGVGYWSGASNAGTQSNASTVRQERHYCTTTAVAGISIIGSSGCRVEQCIVEGGAADHALIYDAENSTVVKDFLIDNFWIEVSNAGALDGIRKSGFKLSPNGGLVEVKGVYAQYVYSCFNNSRNSWTPTSGGAEGEYELIQADGDLITDGSGAGLTIVVNVNSSGVISSWRLGGSAGDTSGFVDGEVITIPAGKLGASSTAATITVKARDLYESGETGEVGEIKAGIPLIDADGSGGNATLDLGTSYRIVGHKIKGGGSGIFYHFDGLDGGNGGWPDNIVKDGSHTTEIPVDDNWWLAYKRPTDTVPRKYPYYRNGRKFNSGRPQLLTGSASTYAVEGGSVEMMSINAADENDYKGKVRVTQTTVENIAPSYFNISTRAGGTNTEKFRVSYNRVWVQNSYFQIGDDTDGYTFPSTKGSDGQVLMQVGDGTPAGLQFQDITQATGNELVDGDFTAAGIMTTDGAGTYSTITDNSTNWNTAYTWGNHATAGYLTDITGEALGDLTDVSVTSPSDAQVLTYDSGAGLWQAQDATGGVDTSGTPANNQLAVFTDADTIEGDAGLTWDGNKLSADALDLEYSTTLATAGDHSQGAKVTYNFGTTTFSMTRGDVYYFNGGWVQSDADAVSSASGLLAVATGTTSTVGMLLSGVVRVADNTGFSSASPGDVLYLDTNLGHVTSDVSTYTTGDVVRVVGYVINATNKIIYFDPSRDWIELS